jgi:hypothetical protein
VARAMRTRLVSRWYVRAVQHESATVGALYRHVPSLASVTKQPVPQRYPPNHVEIQVHYGRTGKGSVRADHGLLAWSGTYIAIDKGLWSPLVERALTKRPESAVEGGQVRQMDDPLTPPPSPTVSDVDDGVGPDDEDVDALYTLTPGAEPTWTPYVCAAEAHLERETAQKQGRYECYYDTFRSIVGTTTGGLCTSARSNLLATIRDLTRDDPVYAGFEKWLPEQWARDYRRANSFNAVKSTAWATGVYGTPQARPERSKLVTRAQVRRLLYPRHNPSRRVRKQRCKKVAGVVGVGPNIP